MNTDLRYLESLVRLMRAYGVAEYRDVDFSVVLAQAPSAAPGAPMADAPAPVGLENGGEPTEEQMLYWSAGGELPKAVPDEVPHG